MLQDIMDQFDTENNFEYCFSMYCNFLEREGKWNLCEDNKSKNNFKCRMRKQYKGDTDIAERSREYKKFENWIEKRKVREQKQVEMVAIKIARQDREKNILLEKEITSLKEQLQEKDKIIKSLQEKHETLLNKYLEECDSDSD